MAGDTRLTPARRTCGAGTAAGSARRSPQPDQASASSPAAGPPPAPHRARPGRASRAAPGAALGWAQRTRAGRQRPDGGAAGGASRCPWEAPPASPRPPAVRAWPGAGGGGGGLVAEATTPRPADGRGRAAGPAHLRRAAWRRGREARRVPAGRGAGGEAKGRRWSGVREEGAGERWRQQRRLRRVPPSLRVSFKPAPQDDAASGTRSPEAGRAARALPEGWGGAGLRPPRARSGGWMGALARRGR